MENISDIVITSRIRLARNVDGLVYPSKLNDDRAMLVARKVYDAINRQDTFNLFRMANISEIDGNVLREKHLISPDLLSSGQNGAAIINESETISIMINEEDHIREQCILNGLSLKEAYKTINILDDAISADVQFAFDPKLGYLTSCPTNIGTGMRASAMMFLPGLSILHQLEKCVNAAARLNMTVRGIYGEGSSADGYLFQISNQKTLGVSEQEIIDSVEASIGHIADAELRARGELLSLQEAKLRDQIMRAYGILCHAYLLESKEFMQLIALVKLGAYYGFIKISEPERLERLFTDCQPANITDLSGKNLTDEQRDSYRAHYVKKTLKDISKVK